MKTQTIYAPECCPECGGGVCWARGFAPDYGYLHCRTQHRAELAPVDATMPPGSCMWVERVYIEDDVEQFVVVSGGEP